MTNAEPFRVAALYHFAPVAAPDEMRSDLLARCIALDLRGTLLVAEEGINGTIAGSDAAIDAIIAHLRSLPGFAPLHAKFSRAQTWPFGRMKVKRKREIVTMGAGPIDPAKDAGAYVEPQDWNALIASPGTILIDTRNDYEVEIGTFAGAINPDIHTFREFPGWFDTYVAELRSQGTEPRIAMFCTGGIRCEKSTAFARSRGIDEVYHLRGGILQYLEDIPADKSQWEGGCFVFDERVAIGHGLEPTGHVMCEACGRPFLPADAHDCNGVEAAA